MEMKKIVNECKYCKKKVKHHNTVYTLEGRFCSLTCHLKWRKEDGKDY